MQRRSHAITKTSSLRAVLAAGLCLAIIAGVVAPAPAAAADDIATPSARASFRDVPALRDARHLADWIVDSSDSNGLPFIVVDKKDAKVFLFSADGQLIEASAALLGLAIGDDTVPGIGERPLSQVRPYERTTPAGRFVAALDHNLDGHAILWIDYDAAFSLHPIVPGTPKERRAQRMATPTPQDNRISFGCINVPARFFNERVTPAFLPAGGIVYVLPEVRAVDQVFASYDVDERIRARAMTLAVSR